VKLTKVRVLEGIMMNNKPSVNKLKLRTKISPVFLVKSVFVVKAYTVKTIVRPAVKNKAKTTSSGSKKEVKLAKSKPSKRVKSVSSIKLVGYFLAKEGTQNSNSTVTIVPTKQMIINHKLSCKNSL